MVSRGGEALPVVLRSLEARGIAVADIALSRPSLDDVFLRATGHSLRDEGAGLGTRARGNRGKGVTDEVLQ